MILLFRSNGITASRVNKYVDYYKSKNLDYKIIGWDRIGEHLKIDNYFFFNYPSRYVQCGLRAVIDKVHWMRFVYKQIKKYKSSLDVVHACDIDTAFPVAIAKIICRLNFTMIFDSCDWASAVTNNFLLRNAYKIMEHLALSKTNSIIICEPERRAQLPTKIPVEPITMRNIPLFPSKSFLSKNDSFDFNNSKITVSYVGWFGGGRFLDELLNCAEQGSINLLIAGFGQSNLEERCKKLAERCDNIRFFGKVEHKFGMNIMYNSDLIYAMYCKYIPNHIYAAPNKFYEAMFLGVPILSTKGTNIGDKILVEDIGFIIEEDQIELNDFMQNLSKERLKQKGLNASNKWEKYRNMTKEFFDTQYSQIVH
jgi:glycosyltransferase involved in cell wall biosynthesis